MKKGFGTLSKIEKDQVIPLLISMLEHRDSSQAFTNAELREALALFNIPTTDADIRRYVFNIRNSGMVDLLIANGKGHFVAKDTLEVESWIAMQESKIRAMEITLSSIKDQYKTHKSKLMSGDVTNLGGQLDLFDVE